MKRYLTMAARHVEKTIMDIALGPVPAGKPGIPADDFAELAKSRKQVADLEGQLASAKRHNRRLSDELSLWQTSWRTLNSLNTNPDTGFSLGGK